jgi:hypothetical protein
MKTRLLVVLLIPGALVTTAGLADDKGACLDAVSKGQRFKDHHKLVEAREQFRVCAAAVCPAVVQSDCATWLAEVDTDLPTVVVTAKNGVGADLVDVKVSVDGVPLVSKLDGQAVPINAGPHTFHFSGVDGSSLDKQVVVMEGEKNQAVAVALVPAAPSMTLMSAGEFREWLPAASPPHPPPASASAGSARAWKTVGWVLGGAGVVGLGVGTAFGISALGDKNAHCTNNVCDPGTTGGIKSGALASDVGWIAGGVLLASGAALVLFAPSGSHEPTASVSLLPVLTASGGEIVAGGSW